MVGPAARASGLDTDTRSQFPYGAYKYTNLPLITLSSCDVFARARMRSLEIDESLRFIFDQLENIPSGSVQSETNAILPNNGVVSLTEGWRGEICHTAITNEIGNIYHYKVKDPSMHNWMALALAVRNQEISDFPVCNKSFNLSYCGHDL